MARTFAAPHKPNEWRPAKMSAPDYGVLLTFRNHETTVRAAPCFECNLPGVFDSKGDSPKSINREEGFAIAPLDNPGPRAI